MDEKLVEKATDAVLQKREATEIGAEEGAKEGVKKSLEIKEPCLNIDLVREK